MRCGARCCSGKQGRTAVRRSSGGEVRAATRRDGCNTAKAREGATDLVFLFEPLEEIHGVGPRLLEGSHQVLPSGHARIRVVVLGSEPQPQGHHPQLGHLCEKLVVTVTSFADLEARPSMDRLGAGGHGGWNTAGKAVYDCQCNKERLKLENRST